MTTVDKTGFIRTLNNMGFMLDELDDFSRRFVESAIKSDIPSLDVGCAFGVATIPAVLGGAKVVANDVHAEHLEILSAAIPSHLKDKLILHVGSFPDNFLNKFGENFFGNVLISRVMHFFSGDKIEECFETLYKLLIPGGKAFIINETPYLKNLSNFIDTYEKRLHSGEKWPGEIHNFREIDSRSGTNLPNFMHLLDIPVLNRVASQFNFLIEECTYIKRVNFPKDIIFDGRESVGIIIQKPL